MYTNQKILDLRFAQIDNIFRHNLSNFIPIVVLLFPLMLNFNDSKKIYIHKVSDFLKQKRLDYIVIISISLPHIPYWKEYFKK